MDEFCPLCRKNGHSRRIKLFQLNFKEAVYLCESEKCEWPYGYEEFKFVERSIPEISKKSKIKSVEQEMNDGTDIIPISTELFMYTPPMTPSNDGSSSKELVKGISLSSILDDFFDSTTITENHCHENVSHLEKSSKPRLGDSYGVKNNSTPKTPITSTIITKKENEQQNVSSIFDIDSPVKLSTIYPNRPQIETVNYCNIKNDDGKNSEFSKPNEKFRTVQSSQLASKSCPPIQNVEMSNVNEEMKSEKKFESTHGHISNQFDKKLNEKVVIFHGEISNGSVSSDEKILHQMINRKRPLFDDNTSPSSEEQTPKKFQRISSNQDSCIKDNKNTISELSNELLLEGCVPVIKSIHDISINETTGESHLVNNSERITLNISPVKSKEASMNTNSFETSVNVFDSLNLDSFFDENLLENCPNSTQDINDDWLQSFSL